MPPHGMAVEPDLTVTEHAVKLDAETSPEIGLGDVKRLPIPADGVLWVLPPNLLVGVLCFGLPIVAQCDSPVVWHVHSLPGTIIEARVSGPGRIAGLGEAREVAEVLSHIGGMSQAELPVEIHLQAFAHGCLPFSSVLQRVQLPLPSSASQGAGAAVLWRVRPISRVPKTRGATPACRGNIGATPRSWVRAEAGPRRYGRGRLSSSIRR